MADACKCDRCGSFFEFKDGDRIILINGKKSINLCGKCNGYINYCLSPERVEEHKKIEAVLDSVLEQILGDHDIELDCENCHHKEECKSDKKQEKKHEHE